VTLRRIVRRECAQRDLEQALGYYADRASGEVARHFLDAVEAAMRHIALHPESGSPRYADVVAHDGLRIWPVSGFPYLIFYFDCSDRIDVWRLLHAERDIPARLQERTQALDGKDNLRIDKPFSSRGE